MKNIELLDYLIMDSETDWDDIPYSVVYEIGVILGNPPDDSRLSS